MPLENCVELIATAGKMSLSEAKRLLEDIEERSNRLRLERGLTERDAILAAAKEAKDTNTTIRLIEKRNALLNLQKRIARRRRLEDTAKALNGDLYQAMRNQIVAINTPVDGGRYSAEAQANARRTSYYDVLTRLKKAGLDNTVRKGTLDDDWARELYELSLKAAGDPRANPGVTRSAEARKIAQIFHETQEAARVRLNREGAWIGQYAGYITRTTHDPDLIRRAGLEGWRAFIAPLLDEHTFDGRPDRNTFLAGAFRGLVTGDHLSDSDSGSFKDPAFTGPANLAGKLSESRVLHFKDAESWLAYQRRFGTGTLLQQMLGSFDRAARQEALMARWGTNPRAELNADIDYLRRKYANFPSNAVDDLKRRIPVLNSLFDELDGTANRSVSKLGAEISASLRNEESMAKLGGVLLTHLGSGATKAGELRYQGVGFFERYADFFTSVFNRLMPGEAAELNDLLSAGLEGMHGWILNRFTPNDTWPGTMSKLMNRFITGTGLNWMIDAQKSGAQRVMARLLGTLVDREFDKLPPETQRAFRQYDITTREWDAVRTAPDHIQVNGRVHLTPDAANRADTGAITQAWQDARASVRDATQRILQNALPDRTPTDGEIADFRDKLGLKLHAYLQDVADRAIITPGVADRALVRGGTLPGTPAGEALRFVAQFKLWGLAAVRQSLGREFYGEQGLAGAVSGIIQLAIAATAFGYMRMFLSDLSQGKNPRPPNSPATWAAALMQGGGFGILGDFVFGEFSRFGGSLGDTLLGPVLGQGTSQVIKIWNDLKEGRGSDLSPDAVKLIMDNLPFVNMFYSRAAINYLFLHSLQETMNPGYLKRSEQSLRRRTGQTYFLSPASNHLHIFGR